jgi:hypothetical protein
LHPGDYAVAKALAKKSGGKYSEEEILNALRYSGLKDGNGNVIVAEGTQEVLIPSGGTLTNAKTGTTIQDTYKVDSTIPLRPDSSYPTTLVEDKPSRPSNELVAYITANTGGVASPYVLTKSPTTWTTSSLPAAPEGTTRVTRTVDGKVYFPLVASCPAADCANGDPLALAMQDSATKDYQDAIARKQENDLNIATAMLGAGGAVVRAVKTVDEIVSTAVAANNASKTVSIEIQGAATDTKLTTATNAGVNGTYAQKGTSGYGATTYTDANVNLTGVGNAPPITGTSNAGAAAKGGAGVDDVAGTASQTSKYIDILSAEDKQHILYGDGPGSGGHLWPGQSGKTVFPENWSADKVVHEIGDIATSPTTQWYAQTGTGGVYTKAGDPAKWVAYEIRDSVRIRVVYEPATGRVVTAFPDNISIPNYKPIKN